MRLAEYCRQFERTSRSPGDDPSVFAIELGGWSPGSVINMNPRPLLFLTMFLVRQPGMRLFPVWGLSGL